MNKILLAALLVTLQFLTSCKDKITGPDDDTPGRRDYTWTIDTINYPYETLYRLWGSSPTDLWATGGGGDVNNLILHFDGAKWNTGITSKYGIYYSPRGIYGFGKDNIYLGTFNGGVWHFDGNSFNQIVELQNSLHDGTVFDNIWGNSSNDFYAVGAYVDTNGYANNPVIAHFLNGKWEILNTDGLYGIVEHLYENSIDNRIYLQVIGGHDYADSTTLWEYCQGKYSKLYSNVWVMGLQADIGLINGQVYFAIGDTIKTRLQDQFRTVLAVDNPNFYQRIWGRNSKDMFLMMLEGLAHYNGTDIEYLFHYGTPTQIYGAALFDNDVFFLINDPQGLSLVYHGKLEE